MASIAQSLASDDENVRELGADSFVNVNVQWKAASARIRDIAQRHENPLVRYRASYLFGRYGKAAARILTEVKSLLTWLGDNEKEEIGIRALALTALAKIEAELPNSADIPLEFPDREPIDSGRRLPAELEKSLLALLDTCLEWTDQFVSQRKLHESLLLEQKRREYGLKPEVSLTTVLNHLNTLARLCKVDGLLQTERGRQASRFRDGAIEGLRAIRADLIACKERKDQESA